MTGVDAELLAHGFNRVAPKPINPAELIWAIGELRSAPSQIAD